MNTDVDPPSAPNPFEELSSSAIAQQVAEQYPEFAQQPLYQQFSQAVYAAARAEGRTEAATTAPMATPSTSSIPTEPRGMQVFATLPTNLIEKPPKYGGERDNDACKTWVRRFEMFLYTHEAIKDGFYNDETRVRLAAGFFVGKAWIWWSTYSRPYDSGTMSLSYTGFKEELIDYFRDVRTQEKRRDEFDRLHQTASADAFYQKIRECRAHLVPVPSDNECLVLFRRGIKDSIRQRLNLMHYKDIPETFEEYATNAINQERHIVANAHQTSRNGYNTRGLVGDGGTAGRDEDGDVEISLHALRYSPRMSKEEKDKYFAEYRDKKLCFRCAQPGHSSKEYKQKAPSTAPRGKAKGQKKPEKGRRR